jgi:L-ascorbate metabolism protein UlaG (beta-lactamase superfamily)
MIGPADPFAPARRIKGRFVNASGHAQAGFLPVLKWFATRQPGTWPKHILNGTPAAPLLRGHAESIRVTVIGHATVLIQVGGMNILTDPVWAKWAGPLPGFGVKRARPPAIAFDDLPAIDVVLLSHSHYDHLDRAALTALERRDRPLVVTGLKVGRVVPHDNVFELDWWQRHALGNGIAATYVPAEHFSARGPFDRNVTLWGGFVLETPAGTIYFAGDTGDGAHIAAIRERFGPKTLSLLPIGAYVPAWFMAPIHMNPHEAVAASEILQSRVTLPIHYGTFPLADDSYHEPLRVLDEALNARRQAGVEIDFRVPEFGEAVVISR